MFTQPEAFGMSVNAVDIEATSKFYQVFIPTIKLNVMSLLVSLTSPLCAMARRWSTSLRKVPTTPSPIAWRPLRSIRCRRFEEQIKASGGSVLLSSGTCPCTDAAFSAALIPAGINL